MQQEVIADRYAQALLAVATEQNIAERVLQQTREYQDVAAAACASFLANPNIPHSAKEDLMKKLFYPSAPGSAQTQEGSGQILIPLIRLLLRKNRIRLLPDIFRLYAKRYAQQKGVVTAKLYVTHPLDAPLLDRLRSKLSERWGKTVEFDVIQDPQILGGFIVATETELLDASLRRTLHDLGEQLKAVPLT